MKVILNNVECCFCTSKIRPLFLRLYVNYMKTKLE